MAAPRPAPLPPALLTPPPRTTVRPPRPPLLFSAGPRAPSSTMPAGLMSLGSLAIRGSSSEPHATAASFRALWIPSNWTITGRHVELCRTQGSPGRAGAGANGISSPPVPQEREPGWRAVSPRRLAWLARRAHCSEASRTRGRRWWITMTIPGTWAPSTRATATWALASWGPQPAGTS